MSFEVDDVRAWLIKLYQLEAAALLSEAEFDDNVGDRTPSLLPL